jgi:hypothetical protein
MADAAAHYDSGLMDYDKIENCKRDVLIAAMTQEAVEKALPARTKVWTVLLRGEAERWETIDNLRETYRRAANKRISATPLSARWDGTANQYEYSLTAEKR